MPVKARGTIRSLEGWQHEGSGATASLAREQAVTGLPEAFELVDVSTVSAKPGEPVTMRASALSRAVRRLEAEGADQAAALRALREQVPQGFRLLGHVIEVS